MIIALDLDGVFRDFTGSLIRQFKLDYPHLSFQIPQFESQIITWELEDYWPPEWTDERLKEYFVKMKIKNKNKDPIINLKEATEIGLINSTDIFIAINEDPQIALNKIKSNRLLDKNLFIRKNYLLFFG